MPEWHNISILCCTLIITVLGGLGSLISSDSSLNFYVKNSSLYVKRHLQDGRTQPRVKHPHFRIQNRNAHQNNGEIFLSQSEPRIESSRLHHKNFNSSTPHHLNHAGRHNKSQVVLHSSFSADITSYGEKCRKKSHYLSQKIPIYYVNLNISHKRRSSYERQLKRLIFHNFHRIEAIVPKSHLVKHQLSITSSKDLESKELSCLFSHLVAIHTAIYDEKNMDEPYALITEDDILYELDVNFTALIQSSPKDFGILQMMSSNAAQVDFHYRAYEKLMRKDDSTRSTDYLWTKWDIDKSLWSTQAYVINKRQIKPFVDQVIRLTPTSVTDFFPRYFIDIINPSPTLFPCRKQDINRGFKCFFPYRIVADYYLYLGCGPTYFSNVPIFNGAKVESTIHTRSSKTHATEFDEIGRVILRAKNNTDILPPFISPYQCSVA